MVACIQESCESGTRWTWFPVRCQPDDDNDDDGDTGDCRSPVELSYRVLTAGSGPCVPSRVWRCAVDMSPATVDVLTTLVRERHAWDATVKRWRVVERLDDCTDLFHYVISAPPPHTVTSSMTSSMDVLPRPPVDVCELR